MAVDGFETQIKNHRNFSWLIQLIYDIFSCHKDDVTFSSFVYYYYTFKAYTQLDY